MAKSIEQRAKEYTCCNYSRIGDMYMDDGIKTVYTEAAIEQRNLDIEKACDWLTEHVLDYVSFDHLNGIDIEYDNLINDLKKTMEEER